MAGTLHRLTHHWWDRSGLKRIFLGEGPQTTPYELNRRRIFILPTRHGLLFAAVLFIMLLGAMNYNNSLAFLLTFLLASLAIVSMLHTYRNLAQLVLRAGNSAPVFAGQEASFTLHIDHPGSDPRYAVQLAFSSSPATTIDIPPQQTTSACISFPAQQRGWLQPGRLTIATRYPLGLFRAWSRVDMSLTALVYPQPASNRELPVRSLHPATRSGDQERGCDDFAGFRAYHQGDSLRHIYWKGYARGQPLLTKQFAGGQVDELWLDWELAGAPDTEARLRQLCRWILEAEQQQLPYGLRMPGVDYPPATGMEHRQRCLRALALFGETDA